MLVVLLLAAAAGFARADNPAEVVELGKVDVVGTTPLPGLGVPLAGVPANVQSFAATPLRGGAATLPDFLERNAAGVSLSSGQGNPFQPDFAYRGFVASPLLGVPQGVSVFQDGVRVNEPFGDVVNWDLLPGSAISSVQLIPGTTPLFGPNALGGILAIYTKSGAQFPGGAMQGQAGSFGRRAVEVEQGGRQGDWDYFLTAHALRDDGWAAQNPSRVRQFFAKVGYQTDATDLDLSVTVANNRLNGTQALPLSFTDDIRQPYTYPDRNGNRMGLVAVKGSRFLGDGVLLGGNAYARRYRNESLASNVNADFQEGANQGTNDRSVIDQSGWGLGAQLTLAGKAWGRANQLVVGASGDYGAARFTRESQDARFSASREAVGIDDFVAGTDAASASGRSAVFFSNSFSASERWVFTLSGRYDVARVRISDRSGQEPLLDGSHRFSRMNPGVGVNYVPSERLTAYVSYGESMRAPTPIELTCADAAAPCRLPNNFLADPPLLAVVARTVEAGARGKWAGAVTWSAAVYRTDLANDIQFVSSGEAAANAGYFRNVGATRRQGVELAATARWATWELSARYGRVDATFRAPFSETSPNNSSADASGAIHVPAGSRIPGIPRDTLRLGLGREVGDSFAMDLALAFSGPVHARGDENNRDINGRIPGYGIVNAGATWKPAPGFEVFATVNNLLNKRYSRSGLLGRNFFNGPERAFDAGSAAPEQFRGPGTPFGAWTGVRYRWK